MAKQLAAGAAVVVAALAAGRVLAWGTRGPLEAVRLGTATFDELAGLAAALAAWAVLAWVAAVFVATALAALPGAAGSAAERLAVRIAPGLAGRLARVALGLTLTAGPVSACTPALAGNTGQAADVVATEPVANSELPAVDRIGPVVTPEGSETEAAVQYAPRPHRTPAPAEPTAADTSPTPTAGLTTEPTREEPPTAEIAVRRGDSLWAIAARHLGSGATAAEVAAEWPRWYAENRAVIGDDPDLILPGMILRPPNRG